VSTDHLPALVKIELDQQVATAKQYPRELSKFRKRALELVTLNEHIADECIYALMRTDRDGEKKVIEGPSIRFAEVMAHSWGNIRRGARVVEEGNEFVVCEGVCHDLETNDRTTLQVRRRVTNRNGKRFSTDMIGVTCNAANSIAMRNAILQTIPRAVWEEIYAAARKVVAGDVKTLASRRDEALKQFALFGIDEAKLLNVLDVAGIQDITIDHLVTLKGMLSAIREGELSPESIKTGGVSEEKPAPEPRAKAAPIETEAVKKETPAPETEPTSPPTKTVDQERQETIKAFDSQPTTPSTSSAPKFSEGMQRNGSAPITPGAAKALRHALGRAGIDETEACLNFKIGNIEELPSSRFTEAMAWVTQKAIKQR